MRNVDEAKQLRSGMRDLSKIEERNNSEKWQNNSEQCLSEMRKLP